MTGQPFALKLITPPATEPVTLTEAKARLRITITDEDDDITSLIKQARELCEAACQRAFITQTWSLYLDDFPRHIHWYQQAIRLPRAPLQSVTWIKYYDTAGVQRTYDAAMYHVTTGSEPGRIAPLWGAYWQYAQFGRPEAVEVRFVAGYGAASDVPNAAKAAILLTMKSLRDDPSAPVPPAARAFLDTLETGEVR